MRNRTFPSGLERVALQFYDVPVELIGQHYFALIICVKLEVSPPSQVTNQGKTSQNSLETPDAYNRLLGSGLGSARAADPSPAGSKERLGLESNLKQAIQS
jgi:hypothetical protein